jgi:hypothetical protein
MVTLLVILGVMCIFLSDGSFEMLNPRCPDCGSFDVIKKDFVESSPKVEYHGNYEVKS